MTTNDRTNQRFDPSHPWNWRLSKNKYYNIDPLDDVRFLGFGSPQEFYDTATNIGTLAKGWKLIGDPLNPKVLPLEDDPGATREVFHLEDPSGSGWALMRFASGQIRLVKEKTERLEPRVKEKPQRPEPTPKRYFPEYKPGART